MIFLLNLTGEKTAFLDHSEVNWGTHYITIAIVNHGITNLHGPYYLSLSSMSLSL
jgi:hypothetical protein